MKHALLLMLTMFGLLQVACVTAAEPSDDDSSSTASTTPTVDVDVSKNVEPAANTVFGPPTKTVGGLGLPPPLPPPPPPPPPPPKK